ncbi:MAG TPA: hypothetical protein VMC79_12860 [Rectinemataceae bacterium]|nr:hypothetical protein [Rectinemataceae bacterium]
MNVRFCESCRSLVLADFRFCPYCGQPVIRGPGLEEALSAPFERMAARTSDGGGGSARMNALSDELDRLEADMELILSQLEPEIGGSST